MKITVIGTGYVGLVAGTCFSDFGNDVICVDKDETKIKKLNEGISPIYEEGLEDLIVKNLKEHRLNFTINLEQAVKQSDVIFVAVGTPPSSDGTADLSQVAGVIKQIAAAMNEYKIIVMKSTVPVGTASKMQKILGEHTSYAFDIVSNPEFLKEGVAVYDFLRPDRVIIGTSSENARQVMKDLYEPFVRNGNPILCMDNPSAEMSKYVSNAFLATKISFINEIANLCEKCGVDVEEVRKGITTDSRIGKAFLYPGIGYGGSCFPKDVQALLQIAKEFDSRIGILEEVEKINKNQKTRLIAKAERHFKNLSGKTFAIWGLSFKPKTDDMREAPSIEVIQSLLNANATVHVHDPAASHMCKNIFGDKVTYFDDQYKCIENADALFVLTEWNDYRQPNFEKIKSNLKSPIVFDGRNIYCPTHMKEVGFNHYCIGRNG